MTLTDTPPDYATLEFVKRWHVERVLAAENGSALRAAKILGVGHKSVYNWVRRWASEDARRAKYRGATNAEDSRVPGNAQGS